MSPGHIPSLNGSTVNNNCHASLAFAIGVLLLLMPLKYPQSTKPLETYNAIMSIFIIVTLVYAAAWEIEHHLQTSNNNSSIHRIIVTKISLFSGSLATVVLVLLIVPEIGWFILLVWTLTLMKQIYEACQMLHRLYQSLSLVSYVFNEVFGPRRHFSQGRNGLNEPILASKRRKKSPRYIPSLRINNNSITSFSFLMGVFLALMNLKFQPQRNIESPFETLGVVMPMFVICMLVYSITFCTPYFPEVIDHINLLARSLATVFTYVYPFRASRLAHSFHLDHSLC
ncbi:hypothetical protein GOBAR_AA31878 [Gossypium barbadense]|uniref:Uncharacterized protein n=1 Tax=Gossypium barbadense TaxID=3634 RepID=A0A2P5WCK2_GOSBA|nr:hypothetical protein GOBAR_AA31878 [Gossypium barbadense]